MRVLVVGKGGREHAIVRALSESSRKPEIWALPGNPGMESLAQCLDGEMSLSRALRVCETENVDLVIIGPEDPLVAGWADEFRARDIRVFGPGRKGALLEGSKVFAKQFMQKYHIPTARAVVVSSLEETTFHAPSFTPPYVLKADGLAGGKGVFICESLDELKAAADQIFNQKSLGEAGASALLEQFMPGYELSFFVLTNGEAFVSLPMAQDHKRLQNGDKGPNTGGMGTVAPMQVSEILKEQIEDLVVVPTVEGIRNEAFDYRGVIFIGLMMTESGPQVLEYNVRFGDPETQVLLPLLDGDWLEAFAQIADGRLPQLSWHRHLSAACVVLAAENYPAKPKLKSPISGDLSDQKQQYFLHAGTQRSEENLVTGGGRVLNAVGVGQDFTEALNRAYSQAAKVHWAGMQMRTDIGESAKRLRDDA